VQSLDYVEIRHKEEKREEEMREALESEVPIVRP
jgi:hypothetical protein